MISVIIPMYNREKTIERAIRSVLEQKQADGSYFDMEVLVIDDCSSDDSVKIVQKLFGKSVKLIQLNKNSGANVARNVGIAAAQGEYIAFHDSDDEWLAGKLAKQLDFLKQEKADLVSCAISWRGGERGNHELHHKEGPVTTSDLTAGNFLSTQTLLMKKEILLDTKFDENLPRLQDWDIVFRLSLRYRLSFLDEVLVYQYPEKNSISRDNKAKGCAVAMLDEKFQSLYEMNKAEKSKFYYHLGTLISSKAYYKKSLLAKINFKAVKALIFGR